MLMVFRLFITMSYSLHNDPSSMCVIMYVTVMMSCMMTYMSVQCDVPSQSRSPIMDIAFPCFRQIYVITPMMGFLMGVLSVYISMFSFSRNWTSHPWSRK